MMTISEIIEAATAPTPIKHEISKRFEQRFKTEPTITNSALTFLKPAGK